MPYKSLVTFTCDATRDRGVLDCARGLAEAEGAHLSVVCLGIDHIQPGPYYAGANAVALQMSLEEAQAEANTARA